MMQNLDVLEESPNAGVSVGDFYSSYSRVLPLYYLANIVGELYSDRTIESMNLRQFLLKTVILMNCYGVATIKNIVKKMKVFNELKFIGSRD